MIAPTAESAPVRTLAPLDFLVVGVALAILGLIAYLAGRKEKDTRDFFLGGRSVPAFVATLSFVAAEISALTVIGVPAVAYSENWHYLQFFVGSAAGRVFVAFLFIPVFYRHNCTTVFEFLRDRFGAETEYAGSAFFFITRLLGAGVRLYAACLGISLIMGWSLAQAVLVFTAVSIALIGFGGIKAVVWTGAFEACVFFLAGVLVGTWLLLHIDGGLAEVWRVAGASGRLSVFNFSTDLGDATTFWAGTANAFFVSLAVFGADQELVQRLLTVRTRRSSQKALISTILAALPLLCCYLSLGTLLFVFYQQRGQPALGKPDEILGWCVTHTLPAGLKGLVLAAIVMTSIDSPLSLAFHVLRHEPVPPADPQIRLGETLPLGLARGHPGLRADPHRPGAGVPVGREGAVAGVPDRQHPQRQHAGRFPARHPDEAALERGKRRRDGPQRGDLRRAVFPLRNARHFARLELADRHRHGRDVRAGVPARAGDGAGSAAGLISDRMPPLCLCTNRRYNIV